MNCRICQRANVAKYNHYGANYICYSCKGFFMRAVQSELYKDFIHAGKCIINSENRRSCKKCRFEKCLEVGMKMSYVKTLEEKCQKIVATVKNDTIPEVQFPDFPEQNYSDFYDSSWETAAWFIYEAYIKSPSAFLAHICQSSEVAMDTDDFLNFLEHTDTLIFSNFAKLQTEKDGVSAEACQVLLKTNFTRLQAVQNILVFMEHFSEIERFIDFGRHNRDKSHGMDQLIALWDRHGSNVFSLDYELFFASPWALDKDIENEHRFIYKTVIYWYMQCQKGSSKLNKCLLTLIYAILLYNTDGISSEQTDVKKIQNIQADYCHLLYQYLNSKHNSKVSHLLYGKALMLIHETQRVYELSQLRLKLPNVSKVDD